MVSLVSIVLVPGIPGVGSIRARCYHDPILCSFGYGYAAILDLQHAAGTEGGQIGEVKARNRISWQAIVVRVEAHGYAVCAGHVPDSNHNFRYVEVGTGSERHRIGKLRADDGALRGDGPAAAAPITC